MQESVVDLIIHKLTYYVDDSTSDFMHPFGHPWTRILRSFAHRGSRCCRHSVCFSLVLVALVKVAIDRDD
jgi:hypothetical protein